MKLEAKVVRNINGSPCFEVRYNERPYKVKLYKFQEQYPDGSIIDCIVTQQANGEIFLRQDLGALLESVYNVGDETEFTVRHDFSHNGYYEVSDGRGVPCRLPVPKGVRLLTGSNVLCRIERIDHNGAQLRLIDRGDTIYETSVPAEKPSGDSPGHSARLSSTLDADTLAAHVETEEFGDRLPLWDVERLFELLFINDDYYSQAVSRSLLGMITEWRGDGAGWHEVDTRLLEMRRAVMYVLEGSPLLLAQTPSRRKTLQQRLTVMGLNISGYHKAAEYLHSGAHEEKVDRVLRSLRTSGYIYQAEKHLDMMMRIFSLSTGYMCQKMADIFAIIHSRSEDFWHDEPFRKAFVRMLELYVEQRRPAVDLSRGGTQGDIKSLIEALSIQLLLADPEGDADLFDYNLNQAMLYRYASMLRTSEPANAMRNAYLALMDVTRRLSATYQWSETSAHDLVASKLTVTPVGLEDTFEKWYTNRQVVVRFNNESVTVMREDIPEDSLKVLDLDGVGVWPGLRIMTSQRLAAVTGTDLKRARTMWNAIETALFSEAEDVRRPLSRKLPVPDRDDSCLVRVTGQNADGVLRAEVTDPGYEGRGTLAMEDLVRYRVPNPAVWQFCDEDGNPLVFPVRVKRVEEGGGLVFSAIDQLRDFSHEETKNDNPQRCVIKSINQYGVVGISEQGDAVRFKRGDDSSALKCGDTVIGNWWQVPDNPGSPYVDGVITEVVDDARPFSTEMAFARLMRDYAVDIHVAREITRSTAETIDSADCLSDQRMAELMSVIERKAASESDYMRAFNHIGLARLLARLSRDDRKREFYEAWMRLIEMLHHFAVNGEIDADRLKEFEENDRSRFDDRSELYRRYTQLKVVSFKGRPDMREELWRLMNDSDEEIRTLAENVMAYNIIADNASMSALGEVSDRINNILKVTGRRSTLHSFGSENKTTEFKTSLIFPPNNHMRADADAQGLEIMKELCALLNADGGRLYLGVNDFGMGVGIENDLAYREFNGSEDKYDLYFRRKVCSVLGRDVDAYIDARFASYGGKRIYEVSVLPYYTAPVKVEGVIYERHGSSKLPFTDPEDVRLFTERRAEERRRIQARDIQALENAGVRPGRPEPASAQPQPDAEAAVNAPQRPPVSAPVATARAARTEPEAPARPERIATRSGRGPCPASFDDSHDPATVRYLEIRGDSFQMTPDFYGYSDVDPDLLLCLPLTEEDMRRWLVLGYADGTVCRVPMKVLADKEDYTSGRRYTGSELVFADVIDRDEALLTLTERKGNRYARADVAEQLPEVAGLRNSGSRLMNTEVDSYRFDVIPLMLKLNYATLFDRGYRDVGRFYNEDSRNDQLYRQMVHDGFMPR